MPTGAYSSLPRPCTPALPHPPTHRTPETPAVVHCFTGTAEQAAAYIARGMYIGLTGTVSMPRRGAALRALLSSSPPAIPLDRLLLETDAPFMHPFTEGSIAVPTPTDAAARVAEAGGGGGGRKGSRRRRTCEPAHMQHILATVAGCLGKTAEEVAAATSANAAAVFGLHVPAAPSATAPGGAAVSGDGTGKQAAPATPPAAAAGGGGGSVPPAVQPVEEVLAEATAGRFVDTHIHLDEVLTALKVAIPGMAQGGSGSSEEEMLAAAIAASLAESGGSEAAAGGGGGAQAAAAEGGAEALDGLHPVLSSLFGAECDGVVAQFCDPASVATSLAVYPALLALRGVVGAFGCHPHHAKYYTESWEGRIREALAHPRAVALGECGLDYAKKQSPKQRQREVLVQQIALAVELGKPIVIHCRNAEADLLDIFKAHLPREWLVHVHCYTGNATHAAALLEGFPNVHFGFTGFITQDNPDAAATRQAIRHAIPPNRILFETDGPWMSPRVRGAHADVVLPVLQRLYDTGRYQSKPAPKVTAAGGGGGKGRRGKGQGAVGCGPRGQTCHAGAIPAIVAVVAREAGVPVRQLMETVRENSRRVYSV